MIKLEPNQQLYYIENMGCDDTTYGLVALTDEEFVKFKTFVENLNKNSTYGCQPTINAYRVKPEAFTEATEEVEYYFERLYFNDKIYRFAEGYKSYDKWDSDWSTQVIGEE